MKDTGLLCSECYGNIYFSGVNKYHVTFTCSCKERAYIEDVDNIPFGLCNWLELERSNKL